MRGHDEQSFDLSDIGTQPSRAPGKRAPTDRLQRKAAVGPAAPRVQRSPATASRGGEARQGMDEAFGLHVEAGARGVAVQRKAVNTTKTPEGQPERQGPETVRPPRDEMRFDTEGNHISERGGHWHLLDEPRQPTFPIHAGAKAALYPINPNASFKALLAKVKAIRDQQLVTAKALRGDMKYWFAKVYHHVTQHELEFVLAGKYLYPHMKLQEVIAFNDAYLANLEAWKAGNKQKVEAHWIEAFGAAENQNGGKLHLPRSMEIMKGLLPSMQAHIRFDLPRAIAACYVTHYEGIPGTSLADFRPDFESMGPVFELAAQDLNPDMNDETMVIDPGGIRTLRDAGFPFIFNIPIERTQAWEKAQTLTTYMPDRSNARAQASLKAEMDTRHPGSGGSAFEVDGTDVRTKVDWVHQPGMKADRKAPAPEYQPAPPLPNFPEKLYFKLDRPRDSDKLEDAIRDDQDLAPFVKLAEWTRDVRRAQLLLVGRASEEGTEDYNLALAGNRAFMLEYFLFKTGADVQANSITRRSDGERGSKPDPAYRYVRIQILAPGTSRFQHHPDNPNLPSEVAR